MNKKRIIMNFFKSFYLSIMEQSDFLLLKYRIFIAFNRRTIEKFEMKKAGMLDHSSMQLSF